MLHREACFIVKQYRRKFSEQSEHYRLKGLISIMKKAKIIVGICLVIQAAAFFLLFLIYMNKKRSLANAFAAVAAVGGTAGALLLIQAKKEAKNRGQCLDEEPGEDDFEDTFNEDDIFCDFENANAEPTVE